jgi:hypothetical protein
VGCHGLLHVMTSTGTNCLMRSMIDSWFKNAVSAALVPVTTAQWSLQVADRQDGLQV